MGEKASDSSEEFRRLGLCPLSTWGFAVSTGFASLAPIPTLPSHYHTNGAHAASLINRFGLVFSPHIFILQLPVRWGAHCLRICFYSDSKEFKREKNNTNKQQKSVVYVIQRNESKSFFGNKLFLTVIFAPPLSPTFLIGQLLVKSVRLTISDLVRGKME